MVVVEAFGGDGGSDLVCFPLGEKGLKGVTRVAKVRRVAFR